MTKNNIILSLTFMSAIFVLFSCKSKKTLEKNNADLNPKKEVSVNEPEKSTKVNEAAAKFEVLSIKRTNCFGKCPSYEAKIFSDGTATYNGLNNVSKMGNYAAVFDRNMTKKLLQQAVEIHYFTLENRYPTNPTAIIADLPFTYTSVNFQGNEKRIANNYDCPTELIEFEKLIDEFVNNLNWQNETKQ